MFDLFGDDEYEDDDDDDRDEGEYTDNGGSDWILPIS